MSVQTAAERHGVCSCRRHRADLVAPSFVLHEVVGTAWKQCQNEVNDAFHQAAITLTHLPLDKMAAFLADDIFKRIFLNENIWISNKISLKYVPWGL